MEILSNCNAASTPLYNGSPHSVLHTLVEHFRWFCEHPGVSKEALSSMLSMQKALLPQPNELPASYEAALRVIAPHIVTPIAYDVCGNDCVLFRGEYSNLTQCPRCGLKRLTGPAARRFMYLPLKPRLMRLFGNSCMAEVLQKHLCTDQNQLQDIHNSPVCRNAYSNTV